MIDRLLEDMKSENIPNAIQPGAIQLYKISLDREGKSQQQSYEIAMKHARERKVANQHVRADKAKGR